jgi:hypothetical protein
MKVTLESTDKIVELIHNGQVMPARIWEGHTERGVAVHAYITRIAVDRSADRSELERDLQETHRPVSAAVAGIPLRLLLP